MPQKLKVSGPVTPEEITIARQTHSDPHDQERLLAIGMAQQGGWRIAEIVLSVPTELSELVVGTDKKIAAACCRGTATIGRWVRKFRQGGIRELLKRSHGARGAQLDAAIQEALKEGRPRKFILREGKWKTAKEIRQFLQQEHGKKLSVSGVHYFCCFDRTLSPPFPKGAGGISIGLGVKATRHYWLKKVKAVCKLPRKQHAKQEKRPRKFIEQVEAFKQNVVNHLLALEIPTDKRLRVWIQDEHRYGFYSTVRRCWTLKGHRPTAPIQMKYKWGYVSGAAEVLHGEVQFLYLPTVSKATKVYLDNSRLFLQQLVDTDPEAIHLVFWDQAGFHPKPDDPKLPSVKPLTAL